MRLKPVIAALALAVLAAGFAFSGAVAQSAPPVGASVKDKNGLPLGVIEKVVVDKAGAPYQVLVRQGRVLRPLPVDGLSLKGGAYVCVLSKAEFEILPPVEE